MEYFVSLERAREIGDQLSIETSEEILELDEAHNRILSCNIESLVDDPPFDNSSMDGFAVLHKDTPGRLKIIGTSQAAAAEELVMKEGEAVRIMTGAQMPIGADAIIMVEKTSTSEDGEWVDVLEEAKPGWVRKQGENLRKGEAALLAGTKLVPHNLGLIATMGHPTVKVHAPLRVSIISTGDELKPPGEELQSGEIYESNSFGLAGLVKDLGCIPIRTSACADSISALRKSLDHAAENSDLIITSGGVSMGEWDLVRKIMEEEGEIHYWRVKIRPGSPPLFGTWKGTPLFGVPGNPVSSHVVFRMLVRPWILKQFGIQGPYDSTVPVTLLEDLKAAEDCFTLRRVYVENIEGELLASTKTHQGSGNLHSLVSANALTYLAPGTTAKTGQKIDVILL